jgi:hypothetical protein
VGGFEREGQHLILVSMRPGAPAGRLGRVSQLLVDASVVQGAGWQGASENGRLGVFRASGNAASVRHGRRWRRP